MSGNLGQFELWFQFHPDPFWQVRNVGYKHRGRLPLALRKTHCAGAEVASTVLTKALLVRIAAPHHNPKPD